MFRIGIIGGTGYTGGELSRLLCIHPDVEIAALTSRRNAGKSASEVHPFLKGHVDLELTGSISETPDLDLVFVATPHGVAMDEVPTLAEQGIKCIDLSGDYRMKDVSLYEKWYGHVHRDADHLKDAVYGMPELFRNSIKGADLVANPGCYATAAILACAPMVKAGLADPQVFVDGKSGTSGAGMSPNTRLHHPNCAGSVIPYSVGTHRHTPEIDMALRMFSGSGCDITFVPHLIPIVRGILTSCYFRLNNGVTADDVRSAYETMYGGEYFVRFVDDPSIRSVVGSNHADVAVKTLDSTAAAFCAIDNLVKGASGQAVQNMNLMLGLDEKTGLTMPGLGV